MTTRPRRDDDPVHVLPEDEEMDAVPVVTRVPTVPAESPVLIHTVAAAAVLLTTDERDAPNYGKAGD